MEELVPLLNKLQDALVSAGVAAPGVVFDLPQIAVVGAQSVGKSSVLESLVGREFLPSGTGIVTRRPLILQLRHVRVKEEYGEFSHLPEKRFFDFVEIRKEIQRETERVGGKQKNVSPLPIFLRISSPHVIDLTLIDLPGITKVPVGDQPSDIELQVRRIVHQYISKPTAIILAVTAANTDIANSDSLKIAREVDPHGQRTVGVVTKIDTLEPGVDCVDLLCNRVIPLRHGYVGVVCRGPRQHAQRVEDAEDEAPQQSSYRAAAQAEAQFFRSHAAYASIASQHGVPYLAKTLNRLLLSHVRQALPELRRKVAALMQQTEAELANYGDPLVEAKANPGALLLHFFSKFARNFQQRLHLAEAPLQIQRIQLIDDTLSQRHREQLHCIDLASRDVIDGKLQAQHTSEQLMGGARINFIFHDWYSRALAEFDPLEGLSDQEIRTAIRNATGPKAALFVPEGAFEILVRKQIQQLETPSLQCVDQVYEELQKIVEKCELAEMSRFACLRERVMEVVRGVLRRCLAPTYQMIHNIIQIELAYINTNHPDFMNNRFTADSPPPPPPRSQQWVSCNSSSTGIGGSNSSSSINGDSSSATVRWTRRQRQQQLPSSPAATTTEGGPSLHTGSAPQQSLSGAATLSAPSTSPQRTTQRQQQQQQQQSSNYSVTGNVLYPSPSSPALPQQQNTSCSSPRGGGGRQSSEQGGVLANAAPGVLPQGGFFSFLKGGSRAQATALTNNSSSSSSGSSSNSSDQRSDTRQQQRQQQHSSKRQPPLSGNETEASAAYTVSEERVSSGDYSPSSSRSSSRGRSSPPPALPSYRQQHSRSLSGSIATPVQETRSEASPVDAYHTLLPSCSCGTGLLVAGEGLSTSRGGGPLYFSAAFRGGAIHLPQVPSVIAPSEIPSEREQIETDLIKSLIWSYFQIVRKNVADAVPKSVMYFMVNTAKDVLQRELVSQLYREELFSELLKEGEDICERRTRCKQLLRSLRGAADILAQIRDYGSNLEECSADGGSTLGK